MSNNDWAPKPKTFKRKLNSVEAFKVDRDCIHQVAKWCGGRVLIQNNTMQLDLSGEALGDSYSAEINSVSLLVPGLGESVLARETDWVVKDEDGRFDVVPSYIFKRDYDYVREDVRSVDKNQQVFVFIDS